MWYPTLLQSCNNINTHSWFNMSLITPPKVKKKTKTIEKISYVSTTTILLELTNNQKAIIFKWLDDVIDVYNLTNEYIKENKLTTKDINFYNLRYKLKPDIQLICSRNKLAKHTADYAVKHCVEMYKSAISNKHKNFNIRNLLKSRRRKNLVIEPTAVSKRKNTIFGMDEIKSSIPLKENMKKNSILQYDRIKKTIKIITPKENKEEIEMKRYEKCGIDIGVRTFLTVYNPNEVIEIGGDSTKITDKIHDRIDKIKAKYDKGEIKSRKRKEKLIIKYGDKIRNKIEDMHNKTASYLVKRYKTMIIGNESIKSMIKTDTSGISSKIKRRLVTLSHYRFRMKLTSMAKKYNGEVKEVSEYMTSKTCHKCKNIKKELGSNKEYECNNCKIKLDRDVNASINIYLLV